MMDVRWAVRCGVENRLSDANREAIMNRSHLLSCIADGTSLSNADAAAAVTAVFSTIAGARAQRETTTIAGLGTFFIRSRAARQGRNPATGATIAAPRALTLKVDKTLRDAVNQRLVTARSSAMPGDPHAQQRCTPGSYAVDAPPCDTDAHGNQGVEEVPFSSRLRHVHARDRRPLPDAVPDAPRFKHSRRPPARHPLSRAMFTADRTSYCRVPIMYLFFLYPYFSVSDLYEVS